MILPDLEPLDTDLSISISTTSPSIISASSLILTPIDFLKAYVRASVFDISRENISEPASIVNGVSSPSAFAMPIAIAVLPVPGCPPISIALPAILPSLIIVKIIPADFLAFNYTPNHTLTKSAITYPTMPWEIFLGSRLSSRPSPKLI